MAGHPHAELMAQYAEDAKTSIEPWTLWELRENDIWFDLRGHPLWNSKLEYRRKRNVIKIGEYELPRPLSIKLALGQRYWFVSIGPGTGFRAHQDKWEGALADNSRLKTGLIHMHQEDAEKYAEVLNKIHQVK